MHIRLKTLLPLAGVAAIAAAGTTIAATPESGKVSFSAPKVEWTGSSTGYAYYPLHGTAQAGTDEPCDAPVCDSFALTVDDVGLLTLTADNVSHATPGGGDFVEIDVVKPDGSIAYYESEQDKPVVVKLKDAPKGAYEVRVITNERAGSDGSYKASAVLTNPNAPAPAGTPAPGATPAPGGGTTTPPPAAAPSLQLLTKKASAKKSKKGLKLDVSSSSEVTGFVAQLFKGKKAVGSGKLAKLSGKGTVKLKVKRLKPGSYTVVLSAKDAKTGQAARLQTKLKITK